MILPVRGKVGPLLLGIPTVDLEIGELDKVCPWQDRRRGGIPQRDDGLMARLAHFHLQPLGGRHSIRRADMAKSLTILVHQPQISVDSELILPSLRTTMTSYLLVMHLFCMYLTWRTFRFRALRKNFLEASVPNLLSLANMGF